jgi:RHS repeat-associated protein
MRLVTLAVAVMMLGMPVGNELGVASADSAAGTISVVAGANHAGNGPVDGAPANSVGFPSMGQVAIASDGSLLFTDPTFNAVWRSDGTLHHVAGAYLYTNQTGCNGDGGSALAAQFGFHGPTGVAVAANGEIDVSDYYCNTVRRIDESGIIARLAGTISGGFSGDGGPAVNATLQLPSEVVLDHFGNLLVVDSGNYRIRKITPDGSISTVAGDGSPVYSGDGGVATATGMEPLSIAVAADNALLIATGGYPSEDSRVLRVDPRTGRVTTIAGTGVSGFSGDGGPADVAELSSPRGLAVDGEGAIFLSDTGNYRVRRIDPITRIITTVAGDGSGNSGGPYGGPATSVMVTPWSLAITPTGALVIADNNQYYGFGDILEVAGIAVPPVALVVPEGQTLGSGRSEHAINPTAYRAEPVDTATGAYTNSTTDLQLSGFGSTFSLARFYNSNDTSLGPLGPGWTHSYNVSLTATATGEEFRGADGQRVDYTQLADGTFVGGPGVRSLLSAVSGGFELVTTNQVHYRFDSTGRIVSEVDRLGHGMTFAYNSAGQLVTAQDAAGRIVTFGYTKGLLSSVTLPDTRKVVYAYTAGRLTKVIDTRAGVTRYTYDAGGRLATIVDQLGRTIVTNTYDTNGRVTSQTDGLGNVTQFQWDPTTQTSTMIDPLGHQWKDVYNNLVLVVQTDPLGNTTTYGYDGDLNVTSITDPNTNTTVSTYDNNGNLLSRRAPAPLNYTDTYTYNTFNEVTSHTDRRGNTTTDTYDPAGNLVSVTTDDGANTQYAYDPATGLISQVTDPRAHTTSDTYDAAGNRVKETSPAGEFTTMTYDSVGRMTTRVDPRGTTTTFAYDAADHVTKVTDPLGHATTTTYNKAGEQTWVLDAAGHATRYAYDKDGHLIKVIAPASGATVLAYDAAGRLISRTDPNLHPTTYGYDDANRQTSITDPLGRTWHYAYDPAGNEIQTTDPSGLQTTNSYDQLNRQVSVSYSDGTPAVTYGYDADNNRVAMTDGAGTVSSTYDTQNRLTDVIRGADTFSYSYDADGNVTQRTYPDSTTIGYSYDNDNRMSTVTTALGDTTYGYDADGNLLTTTLPASTGVVESRTYDGAGRLTNITANRGATAISSFDYTLDPVGNPTQVVTPTQTTTYTYDPAYRIKTACYGTSCTSGKLAWTYDKVGNRLSETRAGKTTKYAYDAADQLATATGRTSTTTFSYNSDGQLITAGTSSYSYDAVGRVTQADIAGISTDYTYDGDGRRLTTTTSGTTTNELWDIQQPVDTLALERSTDGTTLQDLAYGLAPLAATTATGSSFMLQDALGSTVATVSPAGAAQWSFSYEPYGRALSATQLDPSAPAATLQYAGQQLDNTGLYNLRARLYDPTLGQFTATDPIASANDQSLQSPYAYTADRPTVMIDPLGTTWYTPSTWSAKTTKILEVTASVGLVVAGAALVVASGGAATPLVGAAVSAAFGTSTYVLTNVAEGKDVTPAGVIVSAGCSAAFGAIAPAAPFRSVASAAGFSLCFGAGEAADSPDAVHGSGGTAGSLGRSLK